MLNGERTDYSTNEKGQLDSHMKRMKLDALSHIIYKNYFKMNQRPKCKSYNFKLLAENIEVNLYYQNLELVSLLWYQKSSNKRKKVDQLYFIKIKNIYALKDIIKQSDFVLKEFYQESGNTVFRMGENVCRLYVW